VDKYLKQAIIWFSFAIAIIIYMAVTNGCTYLREEIGPYVYYTNEYRPLKCKHIAIMAAIAATDYYHEPTQIALGIDKDTKGQHAQAFIDRESGPAWLDIVDGQLAVDVPCKLADGYWKLGVMRFAYCVYNDTSPLLTPELVRLHIVTEGKD